ncbi:unnamed protein product, partial [Cylicostephanus goldi]
ARIDLHVKEKEAIEERADGYLRDISSRDRDVILANKARDRAERKLNDTLYVANNAKCAHCQISDKMRKHLTDVVAEKTVLLEKCQKECLDAKKRAEQSDRISHILSKDSEKLKFELNRWKSDAERNITEISRLKEKRNTSPDEPKKQSPSDDGPILKPPPPPPQMPTPPEETDAMFNAWLPKGSLQWSQKRSFREQKWYDAFAWRRYVGKREPLQVIRSRTPTDFARHHSPGQDQPCPRDTVPMIGKLPSRITKAKAEKAEAAAVSNGEKNATASNSEENATISDREKDTISDGEKNEKTSASVPPVVAAQSRIAEPKEMLKKGKAKNKNKKKKKMVPPFGFPMKTMQPGPAFKAGPFNGPKAGPFNGPAPHLKSGPSVIQEAAPHPAETIRTRFSSSPLPWHRAEAAAAPVEYNAWERG